MPNEHYGDTDMHIFLFRSKDAIKTMRIAGYYTFNQGVEQWISKKSRETTFLVSAEWNLRWQEALKRYLTYHLFYLARPPFQCNSKKLKAKIATMKLALRFNASVNLKIT